VGKKKRFAGWTHRTDSCSCIIRRSASSLSRLDPASYTYLRVHSRQRAEHRFNKNGDRDGSAYRDLPPASPRQRLALPAIHIPISDHDRAGGVSNLRKTQIVRWKVARDAILRYCRNANKGVVVFSNLTMKIGRIIRI